MPSGFKLHLHALQYFDGQRRGKGTERGNSRRKQSERERERDRERERERERLKHGSVQRWSMKASGEKPPKIKHFTTPSVTKGARNRKHPETRS